MSFVDVDESNFTFGFLVSLPSLLRNELFLPPPGLSQGAFSPFYLKLSSCSSRFLISSAVSGRCAFLHLSPWGQQLLLNA